MTQRHPLAGVPARTRRLLLIATVVLTLLMGWLGAPLENETAPLGIVSFELAPDLIASQRIVGSWSIADQHRAAFLNGLDFLFLLLYSTTMALFCLEIARNCGDAHPFLRRVGFLLAWGQWGAALFDVLENVALVWLLVAIPWQVLPPIARFCAIVKFLLLVLGFGYILFGFVLLHRRRRVLQEGPSTP
ncbi:MAG: hypothetical protein D6795_02235 [Deltaproteobacteria bacterium]|nr:MAG: hypothetical protein D6795_02235 [Deltaproteobacteria bacterium]